MNKDKKHTKRSEDYQSHDNDHEDHKSRTAELLNDLQRTRADFENFRKPWS